jgi:hypothetical protein
MGLWKSNAIIYYQITQLSEQKYRLAIPFAENNFGPFDHIVFVLVLFESPSKTLIRVLFASLYLQICIFYQYIPFLVRLWARSELIPTGNTTENRQNNATYVSYDPAEARNEFARSNCTYTREFDVIPATGASYWPIIAQCTQVRVKPDHLEKLKINISTHRIQTKFCTRKRLNTESIYTYSRSENDEKFKRYSRSCWYEI